MLEIYTDASVGHGKAVSTCILLTDKNFVGYRTFEFTDVTTSIHGEIRGAISALRYAESVGPINSESVTLFVDSIALLNLLKCDLRFTTNKQAQLYAKELAELHELVDKYKVSMRLIRGHKLNHNPNKVVDLISNSMLRYSR